MNIYMLNKQVCNRHGDKTRVMGLSCGVVSLILRLAVLIQYRSVTDTHTHTHTDTRRRHIPRLARRRAVIKCDKHLGLSGVSLVC